MREAIHGTYKTNFQMPQTTPKKGGGLPLGTINDSSEAKQAIFARGQSSASIQFVNDEIKLMKVNSGKSILGDNQSVRGVQTDRGQLNASNLMHATLSDHNRNSSMNRQTQSILKLSSALV